MLEVCCNLGEQSCTQSCCCIAANGLQLHRLHNAANRLQIGCNKLQRIGCKYYLQHICCHLQPICCLSATNLLSICNPFAFFCKLVASYLQPICCHLQHICCLFATYLMPFATYLRHTCNLAADISNIFAAYLQPSCCPLSHIYNLFATYLLPVATYLQPI